MPGTGFTSINQYLDANQGTVANEQAALAGSVNAQTDAAQATADSVLGGVAPGGDPTQATGYLDARGQANAAQDSANSLGSQGGIAGLLQNQYAQPGYTGSAAYWDAGLLGGSPGFADAQKHAEGIGAYLDSHGGTGPAAGPETPTDPSDPATEVPAPTRDPGKDWSDPTAPWHRRAPLPSPRPFGQPDQPNPYPGSLGEYLGAP